MVSEEYSVAKKHIGRAEREILVFVYACCDIPKSSVHGFPTAVDPAITAAGASFSPLPCQTSHGKRFTSAPRVEVEEGADGAPSAPPSGPPPLRRRRAYCYKYMFSSETYRGDP
jgi:hypothetical protein